MIKKKFQLDFGKAVSQFEQALKKFQVRKVIYRSAFRGKGIEFDSYRDFSQEDDASMIDWKASLRSNKLVARSYVEERDLNIYFIVDISNSMLFGSQKKLKAEFCAEIVAALSFLVVNSGDNIGLILFNDKIVQFIRPSKSRNQFPLFIKYLSDSSIYGGPTDLKHVFNEVLEKVNSPYSVFIILSDFLHVNLSIPRELNLIASRYETMALMIRDPLDETIPKDDYQVVLEDPYSGRQMLIDPSVAAEVYRQNAIKQKARVKNLFLKSGIDLLELNTKESFVVPLISFLKRRAGGFTRL